MKLAAMAATTVMIIRQMAEPLSEVLLQSRTWRYPHRPPSRSTIAMAAATLIAPIPRTSGIYWIRCRRNGKIYVGSTVDFRQRWDRHRRALRDRVHHNAPLQQAWNLYGAGNFEFKIREQVPEVDLLRVEQEWIDRTDCTHRKIGFNISAVKHDSPPATTPVLWRRAAHSPSLPILRHSAGHAT